VVGWHLENPFAASIGPSLAEKESSETRAVENDAADPGLAASTDNFLKRWLLTRDLPATLNLVAPEARPCANLEKATNGEADAQTEQSWFQQVAHEVPKSDTLSAAIQRVEVSHSHMREISHPDRNAYVLVRVSDDLASMYDCASRSSGAKPGPMDAVGKAFYILNVHQTMFQPRHDKGDRGTVVLTWGAPAKSLDGDRVRCPDLLGRARLLICRRRASGGFVRFRRTAIQPDLRLNAHTRA
jgi:hypothetical protein